MSTGPTGSTGPTESIEATGSTGSSESLGATGFTGSNWPPPFPTAENSIVEPPHIVTMDELMASHAAVIAKEAADKVTLAPFMNPTREQYRPQLFQWAALGFPGIFVIHSISMTPPDICADGVTRDVNAYINYLTGSDMGAISQNIQSLMTGIIVSFSFEGTAARIHVTKA